MSDLYQTITNKIITALETKQATHGQRWIGQGTNRLPVNYATKRPYSGINTLMLLIEAQDRGFDDHRWLTFKQATAAGAQIRKGERGTQIVFFDIKDREVTDQSTGEIETKKSALLKSYFVFNASQCEGLPALESFPEFTGIDAAEAVLTASGAEWIEQGTRAFYSQSQDAVFMPNRGRFVSPEAFYSVGLHELTHWTGHKSRLARDFSGRFGDEAYAFEELIAELGSAFVCADVGIIPATLEDHAGYIESWLRVLKGDKRAIFTAATQASKAHAFLMAKVASEPEQLAA